MARRANEKLSARFYGPYEIEARVGKVLYRLKLPTEAKIHPNFHVSQLKKTVGDTQSVTLIPPQLNAHGVLEPEAEAVLDSRVNTNSGQEKVLI